MKSLEEVQEMIHADPKASRYKAADDKQGYADRLHEILRKEGYDSTGTPLDSTVQRSPATGNSSPSNTRPPGPPDIVDIATDPSAAAKRGVDHVAEFAVRNALPAAITIGTAAATRGASLAPQLAQVGGKLGGNFLLQMLGRQAPQIAGNALSGVVGRDANTLAGIEPPASTQERLMAGLSSAGPSGATRVGQDWGKLGGHRGEILVNKQAPEEIKNVTEKMRIPGGTTADWTAAKAAPGHIPATNLKQTMREVQTEIADAKSPEAQRMVRAAKDQAVSFYQRLNGSTGLPKGGFSPGELQKELEQLGKTVSKLDKEGGSNTGLLKKMMNALEDDLEAAAQAGIPGAQKLWTARKATHRNMTIDELQKDLIIGGGMKFKPGHGGDTQFDAHVVLTKMFKNPHFAKVFTPIEQQDLIHLVGIANELPKFSGNRFTSLGMRLGGGAIAATTFAQTSDPKLAVGAYLGAEALNAGRRLYNNAKAAMQTDVGRKFVDDLHKKNFWQTAAAVGGQAGIGLTNWTGTKSYTPTPATPKAPVVNQPVITPDMLKPEPKALTREERKSDTGDAGLLEEFKGRQLRNGRRVDDVKEDAHEIQHILKEDALR